ncbi:MAG: HAD family phosphatase [Oscillospiraceae bacterium]|jgi:putative hydrolase of the HAD superfamily|nr:HAD family phosphatase [Oscillospiraceae bacterium]
MKQKNIIFDMGGVLLSFSWDELHQEYFSAFSSAQLSQIDDALVHSGIWNRMDRGDLDEQQTIDAACARLPQVFHAAIDHMVKTYLDFMPVIHATNDYARELKAQGFGIYLLSNAPYAFHRVKRRIPCFDCFDGVFASCDVRLLKPQREIYLCFLERFNLDAKDCFFVDDTQANIDGAAAVGIAGHCFADRDITKLKHAVETHFSRA